MHRDYGCESRAWFAERVFEIEQGEDLLWILQLESPKQLGSPLHTSRNPTHNGATPHLSNHSHFDIGHRRLHPLNVLFRFEILGDEVWSAYVGIASGWNCIDGRRKKWSDANIRGGG